MQNIHLIQTDKPSRLIIQNGNKLILGNEEYSIIENRQHIYITSDEEIKEGDWFIWKDTEEPYIFKCIGLTDTDSLQVENSLTRKIGTFHRNPKDSDYGDWYRCYSKKIVLTTDEDLIADGVQSIDDEFLQWYVKNPSCERVKVLINEVSYFIEDNIYRIVIPKEEQKKHIINMMKTDEELGLYEEETKCYCGHTTYCDCGPEQHIDFINSNIDEFDKALKLYKQETLEEAAIIHAHKSFVWPLNKQGEKQSIPPGQIVPPGYAKHQKIANKHFIAGAKWQQERSYSEEDMKNAFKVGFSIGYGSDTYATDEKNKTCEDWFKEIKK